MVIYCPKCQSSSVVSTVFMLNQIRNWSLLDSRAFLLRISGAAADGSSLVGVMGRVPNSRITLGSPGSRFSSPNLHIMSDLKHLSDPSACQGPLIHFSLSVDIRPNFDLMEWRGRSWFCGCQTFTSGAFTIPSLVRLLCWNSFPF